MASGAEQGVEVRVYEETRDSSRRFRCVDSGGVCWGGLCTDDDYDDFHLDNTSGTKSTNLSLLKETRNAGPHIADVSTSEITGGLSAIAPGRHCQRKKAHQQASCICKPLLVTRLTAMLFALYHRSTVICFNVVRVRQIHLPYSLPLAHGALTQKEGINKH